jgi:hypothetical protein
VPDGRAANHPDAVRHLKRQFLGYSRQGDHIASENDVLVALTSLDKTFAKTVTRRHTFDTVIEQMLCEFHFRNDHNAK